ncbi:hypothetical protein FPHOBKDP_00141 [Listeria phage LPJP1]|nr:hypothetical protein FPHOBKDP_00141 [Listeria phage LPJP1]
MHIDYGIEKNISKYLHEELLTEDIYNHPLLKKIDDEFQKILDEDNINDTKLPVTSYKKIQNIIKYVSTIFNINLIITIDNDNILTYGMMTFIPVKNLTKISNNIKKIVLQPKTGFEYIKTEVIEIKIQKKLISFIKDPNLLIRNNKVPKNYTPSGRILTSILLHEVGHHIFIGFEIKKSIKNDKLFSINGGNGKEITIPSNVNNNKYVLTSTILSILTLSISMHSYMRSEYNADNLPIQYGYGKEVFYFSELMEILEKQKRNSILLKIKGFLMFGKDNYYNRKIKNQVIIMMKKELNNDNNSPKDKEIIIDNLKTIENLE